ncbi:metal-dependent hydrolase [Enterococcus sp. AZ101]|uniref:metal-dependent hydrolase n=1 Tax=Enterococcus sp. AZ101 TaxID=2774742 RepID=UPI003D28353A
MNKHITFQWIGFGGFYINTITNKKILIDPWIKNNPVCPESIKNIQDIDYIFITHAHRDHAEDIIWLSEQTKATIVAGWELAFILEKKGVKNILPINKGGTRKLDNISITAVHADHSGAYVDGDSILYGGEPMGYVIKFEDGLVVYHAGDTNIFSDMTLIKELYKPTIALLPIGDVYTMSPYEAAKAVELLDVEEVIPTHFGVFDFLTGKPCELVTFLASYKKVHVHDISPGEIITL